MTMDSVIYALNLKTKLEKFVKTNPTLKTKDTELMNRILSFLTEYTNTYMDDCK